MKKRTFLGLVGGAAIGAASLLSTTSIAWADDPTDLNVAIILSAGLESAWDGSLIRAFERVKADEPYGLDITWQYTDPLWGDDAGDAMRLFAESGQFDIIWAHSTYSDQVKKMKDEFPNIMFVVVGSGNEGLGGNQYWVYKRVHEPAYVLGVMAGTLTETDTLGVVGTFPADDVNDEINAFFMGARSVNPDITQKVAFIESWYDPGKASEMTSAQIATGADMIFSLAGNFQPCEENNLLCFGNFADQHSFSPDTVLSSALADWEPDVKWIVNEWWTFKTGAGSLDGNTEIIWRGMAEGGAAIASFNSLADQVPDDLKASVDELVASISSGAFEVPLDVSEPLSE